MNYDKKKYKVWDWKSPYILHWVINPGLVINELLLGQTIPKVMLIEREGDKPFYQRSLVPCPHCGTVHNGLKWSAQNKTAYKNWFGYYCDNCEEIIPVHRNLTTMLLLIITFPIWGWFRKSLKQRWLAKQPERYKKVTFQISDNINSTRAWLKRGLLFGFFMFVTMGLVFPFIYGEQITLVSVLIGIPLWIIMGNAWGATMKWWMSKKGDDIVYD